MAVVRLSGGLGNQLFQISLAIAMSISTNTKVLIDIDNYAYSLRKSNRRPEVQNFESEFFTFCNSSSILMQKMRKYLPGPLLEKARKSREASIRGSGTPFGLSPQIEGNKVFDSMIDLNRNSYFIGNYITPQYWKQNIEKVLEEVQRLFWTNEMKPTKVPSDRLILHIRRGDYLTNPKARRFHGICTDDYYIKATAEFIEEFPSIQEIEIFSDDQQQALNMASLLKPHNKIVRVDQSVDPIKTLQAMSNSKFFVGSNSTFSWWSSVLVRDRISTMPLQWFMDSRMQIVPNEFFIGEVRLSQMSLG